MELLPQETISRPLQNKQFQDWMVANYILVRSAIHSKEIHLLQESFRTDSSINKSLSIFYLQYLYDNAQYIIPRAEINRLANYKRQSKLADKYLALESNIIGRKIWNAAQTANVSLYKNSTIGWGYGIEELNISANSIPILYLLYQDINRFIGEQEIAKEIYGTANESARNDVRKQILLLKDRELLPTNCSIKTDLYSRKRHAYSLVTDTSTNWEEKIGNWGFTVKDLDFQDWLSSFEVGLFKRETAYNFSPREIDSTTHAFAITQTLMKLKGYIVPYSVLNKKVYKVENENDRLRPLIDRVFQELMAGVVYTTVRKYGIGVGVTETKISGPYLELLRFLWLHPNARVTRNDIAYGLWGVEDEPTEEQIASIRHRLKETRVKLKNTPYTIRTISNLIDSLEYVFLAEPKKKKKIRRARNKKTNF